MTASVARIGDRDESALALPGELSETAYVLPIGLSFSEWADIGKRLQRVENSVRWWIGDWIRYGENNYGETYTQAVEATGRKVQDLMDMVWVASRVEISERSENLSWSHHREVAALEPPARKAWLTRAEEENLSSRDLREQIKADKQANRNTVPSVPKCSICGHECKWCAALTKKG